MEVPIIKKIRAIYIGDVKHNQCPVFELKENGWFEMLEDNEFRYEKVVVEADSDFLIFKVENNEVILLDKKDINVLVPSTIK
ncbi:hypothetical protein [Clostridium estertheticum]|uniref:hypothetical protein n=1 Tax=Clostridium estertheticum TaxID=238834 RepID=UPI001C7D3506|nr:hypothetical protein [Clostridium estertheticum]MBX4267525.1 hypothetical protein [Clostridium estertheticum]WLC91330.1 hypothetical protein KTC95_24240 [Clostridium estertheticum]